MNAPLVVRLIRRSFGWIAGRNAPQEPWWAEFWSSFAAFFWGAAGIINQSYAWKIPAFDIIGLVADELYWFSIAISLAVWQGIVLRRMMPNGRWWASFFMAWLWGGILLATIMADFQWPGIVFYSTFLLINLHSVLRLRTE
jgi:hypothetical protein